MASNDMFPILAVKEWISPLPAPSSTISKKSPLVTANPVAIVLSLLRFNSANISDIVSIVVEKLKVEILRF